MADQTKPRDLTRDELQRCADVANQLTEQRPMEDTDHRIVSNLISGLLPVRDEWDRAAMAEAARILASDGPDAREVEIAELRASLATAQGNAMAAAMMLRDADAEIARLRARLAMAISFNDNDWRVGICFDHENRPTGKWLALTPVDTLKHPSGKVILFDSADAAFAALDAARGGK